MEGIYTKQRIEALEAERDRLQAELSKACIVKNRFKEINDHLTAGQPEAALARITALEAERDEALAYAEALRGALEEFRSNGTRHDLNPTTMHPIDAGWMSNYIGSMDRHVRGLAAVALSLTPPKALAQQRERMERLKKADRFLVGGDERDPIHIEKMRQRDGSILWAVRRGGHNALSKDDGRFYIEPRPSSRDEEFYREFRYATYEEAEQALAEFDAERGQGC